MRVRVDDIFRAIGSFAVRFRWVVLIAWVAAAVVIPKTLPSLASVTQGNNSSFLPASAPDQKAAQLASPFGTASLSQLLATPGVWSSHQTTPPSPSTTVQLPPGVSGRYVRIQLSTTNAPLSMAEVQVYPPRG